MTCASACFSLPQKLWTSNLSFSKISALSAAWTTAKYKVMELSFEVQQNLASLHDSKSVTFVQDEIFRVVCENLGIIGKFGESVSINDVLEKIITAGNF